MGVNSKMNISQLHSNNYGSQLHIYISYIYIYVNKELDDVIVSNYKLLQCNYDVIGVILV
jgi:hypothetical protein